MRSSRLRLLLFASASDEAVDYLPIAFLPNRLKAKIQRGSGLPPSTRS